VAEQVKDQLRLSDAMARYGGEEFAVLLVQTDKPTAIAIAERIRSRIAAQPIALPERKDLRVSLSVGVSTLLEAVRGADIDSKARELVSGADNALYAAKRAGRNRVISSSG
jgi:diguanylate cyclase (GGDEF)-like protein